MLNVAHTLPPHIAFVMIQKTWHLFSLLCCLLLHIDNALAFEKPLILLGEQPSYDLSSRLEVLEDKDDQWTLTDVTSDPIAEQFTLRQDNDALNFGITESAIWFRLSWHNPKNKAQTLLLETSNPLLDELDVYLLDEHQQVKKTWQTGDARPFSSRPNAQRTFVFELTFPPQQTGFVYIRIQSVNVLYLPAVLWQPNAFYGYLERIHIGWGIYFGMMLLIAFYNVSLFIAIRERTYLYYVLYIASIILFQATVSGLIAFYFNSMPPWWVNRAPLLANPFSVCCAALFISNFLELKKYAPHMKKIIDLTFLFGAGLIASVLLTDELRLVESWTQGFDAFAVFMAITAAILAWRGGLRTARFFLLAWVVLLLAVLTSTLRSVGLLPGAWLTDYAVGIGSGLEAVLLSFALADRVNTLRREKMAQDEENRRLQESFSQTLEKKVVERTEALERANQALERLSNLDGLTQIYNRRFFDQCLEQECRRLQRQKIPLSLIMCDIDHFKNFNDTYGHQAGDDCIKSVAETLSNTVERAYDVVARYGGEEFAIILPQTTADNACVVAEKIKHKLDMRAIKYEHSPLKPIVSMSFGVAAIIPRADDDGKRLIALADKALYISKEGGRDRISMLHASSTED